MEQTIKSVRLAGWRQSVRRGGNLAGAMDDRTIWSAGRRPVIRNMRSVRATRAELPELTRIEWHSWCRFNPVADCALP